VYTVRLGQAKDIPDLEAVDRTFEDHSHLDLLKRGVSQGRVYIAGLESEIVGYVLWGYFWDTIPMSMMARVLEPHRRRGLGRDLYEAVERDLRERGHTFWLSSTEETNEPSRRFHESLGFRPIGRLAELGQEVLEIFYRKDIM
jgi:L-amino acid N-acyltransferase YncA